MSERPSAPTRSQRLAGLLAKLWLRRLLPKPDIESLHLIADRLEAEPVPAEGPPWRPAFDQLISSLAGEARLNEVGIALAYVQLRELLGRRARAYRFWAKQPSIRDVEIARPVIIVGHMRSGTTRVQRLLGCDPRFERTRFYELGDPLPRPFLDLRVIRSAAEIGLLNFLDPALRAVHPTSATSDEEVFALFSFSFYGAQIEAQWRVPGFARYWEGSDRSWVYRELLLQLKTIAWDRRASSGPWLLKAPQFMEDLDLVLEAFPDARLVCLHRDGAEVVGSSSSLVWHQMRIQSDMVDKHWIGTEWLRKTARRAEICTAVRRANPDVPQIDVSFDDMNRDWLGEMRRIYDFLGMELTPEIRRRMHAYLQKAEATQFRRHRYELGEFGLNAEIIRNKLGLGPSHSILAGR